MNASTKQQTLKQIAAIDSMERGTLSTYSFKERSDGGSYHKLQHWEGGKNRTRYVSAFARIWELRHPVGREFPLVAVELPELINPFFIGKKGHFERIPTRRSSELGA
jgi:hypothetical protein